MVSKKGTESLKSYSKICLSCSCWTLTLGHSSLLTVLSESIHDSVAKWIRCSVRLKRVFTVDSDVVSKISMLLVAVLSEGAELSQSI